MDRLVLVVEDRRLDRALEELVGVAAEELVQRVLAGDVDRQAAPAAPGAAPHLAQRRDRARERHDDRRVERADVDPELQRVGRDDRRAARRA